MFFVCFVFGGAEDGTKGHVYTRQLFYYWAAPPALLVMLSKKQVSQVLFLKYVVPRAEILFCSLQHSQILRKINTNVCINELDPLALICLGPETSPNLWNNHWSEGKRESIEPASTLKVLHVLTRRSKNYTRLMTVKIQLF